MNVIDFLPVCYLTFIFVYYFEIDLITLFMVMIFSHEIARLYLRYEEAQKEKEKERETRNIGKSLQFDNLQRIYMPTIFEKKEQDKENKEEKNVTKERATIEDVDEEDEQEHNQREENDEEEEGEDELNQIIAAASLSPSPCFPSSHSPYSSSLFYPSSNHNSDAAHTRDSLSSSHDIETNANMACNISKLATMLLNREETKSKLTPEVWDQMQTLLQLVPQTMEKIVNNTDYDPAMLGLEQQWDSVVESVKNMPDKSPLMLQFSKMNTDTINAMMENQMKLMLGEDNTSYGNELTLRINRGWEGSIIGEEGDVGRESGTGEEGDVGKEGNEKGEDKP